MTTARSHREDPRSRGRAVLGDLHRELLASLVDHRVLTTGQIAALHTPGQHRSTTTQALNTLANLGLADRTRQVPRQIRIPPQLRTPGGPVTSGTRLERGGRRWWATAHGHEQLARLTNSMPDPQRLVNPDDVTFGHHQPTLVINEIGTLLAEQARAANDPTFGPWSWHTTVPLTKDLLADAVFLNPAGEITGLLEVDLGRPTSAVTDRLLDLDAWAHQTHWRGQVLLVCAGGSREGSAAGRRDRLVAAVNSTRALGSVGGELRLRVCTLDGLLHKEATARLLRIPQDIGFDSQSRV